MTFGAIKRDLLHTAADIAVISGVVAGSFAAATPVSASEHLLGDFWNALTHNQHAVTAPVTGNAAHFAAPRAATHRGVYAAGTYGGTVSLSDATARESITAQARGDYAVITIRNAGGSDTFGIKFPGGHGKDYIAVGIAHGDAFIKTQRGARYVSMEVPFSSINLLHPVHRAAHVGLSDAKIGQILTSMEPYLSGAPYQWATGLTANASAQSDDIQPQAADAGDKDYSAFTFANLRKQDAANLASLQKTIASINDLEKTLHTLNPSTKPGDNILTVQTSSVDSLGQIQTILRDTFTVATVDGVPVYTVVPGIVTAATPADVLQEKLKADQATIANTRKFAADLQATVDDLNSPLNQAKRLFSTAGQTIGNWFDAIPLGIKQAIAFLSLVALAGGGLVLRGKLKDRKNAGPSSPDDTTSPDGDKKAQATPDNAAEPAQTGNEGPDAILGATATATAASVAQPATPVETAAPAAEAPAGLVIATDLAEASDSQRDSVNAAIAAVAARFPDSHVTARALTPLEQEEGFKGALIVNGEAMGVRPDASEEAAKIAAYLATEIHSATGNNIGVHIAGPAEVFFDKYLAIAAAEYENVAASATAQAQEAEPAKPAKPKRVRAKRPRDAHDGDFITIPLKRTEDERLARAWKKAVKEETLGKTDDPGTGKSGTPKQHKQTRKAADPAALQGLLKQALLQAEKDSGNDSPIDFAANLNNANNFWAAARDGVEGELFLMQDFSQANPETTFHFGNLADASLIMFAARVSYHLEVLSGGDLSQHYTGDAAAIQAFKELMHGDAHTKPIAEEIAQASQPAEPVVEPAAPAAEGATNEDNANIVRLFPATGTGENATVGGSSLPPDNGNPSRQRFTRFIGHNRLMSAFLRGLNGDSETTGVRYTTKPNSYQVWKAGKEDAVATVLRDTIIIHDLNDAKLMAEAIRQMAARHNGDLRLESADKEVEDRLVKMAAEMAQSADRPLADRNGHPFATIIINGRAADDILREMGQAPVREGARVGDIPGMVAAAQSPSL
ncbi:MAG: hypothetical protein P4M15_02960 [Alphaproteobacteria bacterium]|nr:hypothetical protein [Alphaproteobacteria bacterium]